MKKTLRVAAAVATASLLIAACGGSNSSSDTTAAAGGSADSLLNGEIKCEQQYAGKTVKVFSPVRDSENDHPIADLLAAYKPLEDCTGVKVEWEGTDQFETEINVRLEGGNAPDVIDYPQPGLMKTHAQKGYLQEFPADVAAHVSNDFIAGWDSYGTVDGKIVGMPARSNIKSLVWYSPKAFTDKGYEIPQTLDDLKNLSDKIVADGGTPWCVGAESGVATGWIITDWIEDFMLRTNGEKVYDQWVNHEIPFNDPKVKAAVQTVQNIALNPEYIGGADAVKAIATTKFQDGGLPILDGKCYMHRQASFYSALWPEGTTVGEDGNVNVFYLPSPENGPKYMLGAGDLLGAGTNKPETFDVIRYSGSIDYQGTILNSRKELSPNKSVDVASITDPFTKKLSELQLGAEVFRFDGSDMMPGAVGAGTFWTEVTKLITGESDIDGFLNAVEKSWPKS